MPTFTGSLMLPSADGLTAHAGGGQASATPLTGVINRITIVATVADSTLLPSSAIENFVLVQNGGSLATTVYGFGSDLINGASSISLASGKSCLYFSPAVGFWFKLLSA